MNTPIVHEAPVQGAVVVHPDRDARTVREPETRLQEAVGLAQALDLEVREALIAPLRKLTPATLFGRGKVDEIGAIAEEADASVVVVDDALTPVQQRNLEKAWGAKVIDRTGLILEIFARRARTREGRLQVELARLTYERSRLVRTWTHLERQRGGFGVMGGPGETQIETDRRLLAEKIGRLKRDLAEVRRTRGLQRQARQRAPAPTIALVGYTNAGKSTLFNRLTASEVVAQDMLFATLDPTLRTVRLPGGRPAVLSDTVGFISDLPHELVEAFRATLEEVREADVVLHVRDIASPDSEAQAGDVREVLERLEIDLESRRVLEVWNKVDLLDAESREVLAKRAERSGVALVSATTGEGVGTLLARLGQLIDDAPPITVYAPADQGAAVAWLYRHGRVLERAEDEHGGARVSVKLSPQALGQFERLFPDTVWRNAAE